MRLADDTRLDLDERLSRLLCILNIPIEERWEGCVGIGANSLYRYWFRLGLLSEQSLAAIDRDGAALERTKPIEQFFSNVDYYWPRESYAGADVADIGSGFGHITFWLALSGASRVHTVGDSSRIPFVRRLYEAAVARGYLEPDQLAFRDQFVRVGDCELSPHIAPGSLALVLLNDTLEHIAPRILPSLFKASHSGLRRGGMLIAVQQNTDSPATRRALLPLWERLERETYVPQRRRLIRERIPDIGNEELERLATNTRGLDSVDFTSSIERYRASGDIPSLDQLPPIDVVWDVPDEGDTGIERITGTLRASGFSDVSVYPAMLDSRRSRFLQPVAKLLPGLFLKLHVFDRSCVFVARKA